MKIVLAGKFESAFVRMHDEETSPERNKTGHPYYLDLNRNTDKVFRDGAATFTALAETALVPWELDWNSGDLADACGIGKTPREKEQPEWKERYDVVESFLVAVVKKSILSAHSLNYITSLDLSGYDDGIAEHFSTISTAQRDDLVKSYLRRILHQILAAQGQEIYLLVGDADLRIIAELGDFLASGQFPYALPFPDLRNKTIDPSTFVDGVLNFSPPDIRALQAVRNNPEIQKYGERIGEEIAKDNLTGVTQAAIEAYYKTKAGKKAEEMFEIATWIAKPIHYIPGLDAIMTIAEDVKDAANWAAKRKMRYADWHMIGVKMQTIAIEEFLDRNRNRFPEINTYRR